MWQPAFMAKLVLNERHRHRYEFNNKYKEEFVGKGMDIVGLSPDGDYVEVVEIKGRPSVFCGVSISSGI